MDTGGESCTFFKSWNSSFYSALQKQWIQGVLYLNLQGIMFKSNNNSPQIANNHFNFKFSNIKLIRKAQSSLLFPSITIIDSDKQVYWFASFTDRNSTFLTIQHFYQALLLRNSTYSGTSHTTVNSSTSQRTQLGTKLLKNVTDSQFKLNEAASNLSKQGAQLSGAECVMQDMHQDLRVIERITSGLTSWFGRWRMPSTSKSEDLILVKNIDIPDVLDIEVLYSKTDAGSIEPQAVGVCQLAQSGLTVLTMHQKVVQHFKWSEVSRIRADSPWEITVSRFFIGKPDLSFSLVSFDMPKMLEKLQKFTACKIEYSSCPQAPITSTVPTSDSDDSFFMSSTSTKRLMSPPNEVNKRKPSQLQEQIQKDTISDAEVKELNLSLSQLKALALDVLEEQDTQCKVIDRLSDSVTKANDRIRDVNHKMDALIRK